MYDIKPLEDEWTKYNNKKRKPIYVGVLLFAGMVVAVLTFYNLKEFSLPDFTINQSVVSDIDTSNRVLLEGKLTTLEINEPEVIENIKPPVEINVEKKIEESIPTLPIVENIPILEEVKKKKNTIIAYKKPISKKIQSDAPRKKMHLNIIESSSVSAYKDVEKRFYESHDSDDSLFLAKSYFRKGNYKKAEYWALQTNKVNKYIDESWLIFAKAKVKLGRKNEAIRLLTDYVKMSDSSEAKNLLLKLKN